MSVPSIPITDADVTILVPGVLREYCGGRSQIAVSAPTVRAALEWLEREHPQLYPNVCDETGSVRRHVGLFVNSSHIRDLNGLDTRLSPGDALIILPAVSGG
jgi:adenylyltransferase/sulfurtransferase